MRYRVKLVAEEVDDVARTIERIIVRAIIIISLIIGGYQFIISLL